MRPELIDLTDAEVEVVSGGQDATGGNGGAGGTGGSFSFTIGGATATDTTAAPPPP